MPLIPHERLRALAERILLAAGVPANFAELVSTTLVATNLRGTDSHGIQLLTFYVDQLLGGDMLAAETGRVVSESGTSMVYDASNGMGQVTARICAGHAARLARTHGMASSARGTAITLAPPFGGRVRWLSRATSAS